MEPEAMKVVRDSHDFDNYGGTIAPRPNSVMSPTVGISKALLSEKEHRANQFDFSGTQSKWVNRDLTQTPGYQTLSEGFRKTLMNTNVMKLLMSIGSKCDIANSRL